MHKPKLPRTFAPLLCALAVSAASAAEPAPSLNAEVRQTVIQQLSARLRTDYVFPKVAEAMIASLQTESRQGRFDAMTEGPAFADSLTQSLQAVSQDKHLRVRFHAQPQPERQDAAVPTPVELAEQARQNRRSNHGVSKVERLTGNIGYLKLDAFVTASDSARETAAATMNLLANTDALIIDLRENGGGDPEMVQLWCSYLFGPTPVHLNDLYFRIPDRTEAFWTLKDVAGKRYLDKPVWVLTAKRTFSGAEEFSYNLKNLKRATLVGESTGGGAHPGDVVRLHPHFSAFIANGRAINPITGSNWEGTGVKPDIAVPAADALRTAHRLTLEQLAKSAQDSQLRQEAQTALQALDKARS
ncbi:S41 family peptidase [Parachitinimonas caeni]|uniref:S41 family peptidase n=1 Tax=Parachitinimonas caeni TaxID=3031301 RepID=A0ABT7DSY8_9NEIS|nr:S41 family peptidase [Parachitinimonas caeni]MDK2123074.1 S41 family peptidase [Parachitinimonas caeni]